MEAVQHRAQTHLGGRGHPYDGAFGALKLALGALPSQNPKYATVC